jgi:hypothetical protein
MPVLVTMLMRMIVTAAAIITVFVVVVRMIVFMLVFMLVGGMVMSMVGMIMTCLMIGPAFGMERRFHLNDLGTKAAQHVGDHVIAADADEPGGNLAFKMPIAKMIGNTRCMQRITPAHFKQFFGRRHNLDQAAILQHITVTPAQSGRLGQINQKFETSHGFQHAPPAAARLVVEHDGIGNRGMKMPGFHGADHGIISQNGSVPNTTGAGWVQGVS